MGKRRNQRRIDKLRRDGYEDDGEDSESDTREEMVSQVRSILLQSVSTEGVESSSDEDIVFRNSDEEEETVVFVKPKKEDDSPGGFCNLISKNSSSPDDAEPRT